MDSESGTSDHQFSTQDLRLSHPKSKLTVNDYLTENRFNEKRLGGRIDLSSLSLSMEFFNKTINLTYYLSQEFVYGSYIIHEIITFIIIDKILVKCSISSLSY